MRHVRMDSNAKNICISIEFVYLHELVHDFSDA